MAAVPWHGGPIELDQLIVDDSDGEGEANISLAKTTSTLGAVKSKLIRHMSHETDMSSRARRSIGHSEEEVARRAELRRFRHQRIQDELKDDKKNEASHGDSSSSSHRSTQYLSALIDVGLPRGGPRDNLTFGFDSPPSLMTRASQPPSQASKEAFEDQAGDLSLQMSKGSPSSAIANLPNTLNESAMESRDQLTISRVASPQEDSQLQPHPESIRTSSSQKSLGCSYPSSRLDRVLGPNREFDHLSSSHISDDQSALGIWLIAQSLRTRSNSTGLSADHRKAESAIPERATTPAADLGGIDRVEDTPQSSLQQGHIPPCNSAEPLSQQKPSQNSQSSKDSSSNYPSVLPSFSPSPDRAHSNAPHLTAQDIKSLQLSPFQWQGNLAEFRASEARSSYFTAEDDASNSDINEGHARISRTPAAITIGPTSDSFTETGSFRQRETELRTIEKRFGEVLSRKRTNPIASSRFREEFQDASSGTRRASFKMKLGLSVSKRSRTRSMSIGTNSLSGLLFDPTTMVSGKTDHQRSASGTRPRNKLKKRGSRSLSHPAGQTTLPLSAASSRKTSKEHSGPSPNILNPSSALKADEPSGADSGGPSQNPERPSGAWARFPSQKRSERGRCASGEEGYRFRESDLRDFVSGGQEQGANGTENTKSPPPIEVGPRSLSEKLARGVKMGLSKLITTRTEGSASLAEPQREAESHQSPGHDGGSSADVTVARKDFRCADCSHSSLCGETSRYVESASQQLDGSMQEPEPQAPGSCVSVGTAESVAASDQMRQAGSGKVGDVIHAPIRHSGDRGDEEMHTGTASSAGLPPEMQRLLRRWRSNIDGPVEGASSIWSGPVVAQSLSMNNLRASSDEGSDGEME